MQFFELSILEGWDSLPQCIYNDNLICLEHLQQPELPEAGGRTPAYQVAGTRNIKLQVTSGQKCLLNSA